MKKIIVLSLGFSLFAAGLSLPISEASRDAYHALTSGRLDNTSHRSLRVRPFAGGINQKVTQGVSQRSLGRSSTTKQNFKNYRRSRDNFANFSRPRVESRLAVRPSTSRLTPNTTHTKSRPSVRSTYNPRGARFHNYRDSRRNFGLGAKPNEVNRSLALRNSTDRITTQRNRTIHTSTRPRTVLTPQAVRAAQASLHTFENDQFSLALPEGWGLSTETQSIHTYEKPGENYRLKVKRFEPGTCGSSKGFMFCGVQLSKAENYQAVGSVGKLDITSSIERGMSTRNTILNRVDVSTSTYTEQFNAVFPFMGEKTVARYFVAAPSSEVFMVEAIVPYREAGAYTELTRRIFDSFRLYE